MLTTFAAVVHTVRRLVLPCRVSRFHEDYRFVFPALAWMIGPDGDFRISLGWWRWHVEIVWENDVLSSNGEREKRHD